jgi:hypothetical protein
MRRGHKRTQSATLGLHDTPAEVPPLALLKQIKLEIPALLTKSSAKIKEKVCQMEPLNVNLSEYADPLFTFGRGLEKRGA